MSPDFLWYYLPCTLPAPLGYVSIFVLLLGFPADFPISCNYLEEIITSFPI